jgi:predicted PurR-regulated permease PerM
VNVDHEVRKLVGRYTEDVSGLVQGSLMGVVQFAVAMFILFHLFRNPTALLGGTRRLLPMTRSECDRVFARFADSVYANLYATLVTSVIDGVGGGLMFWALGLPSPVLWGVVMFFLSILPLVGTWLVWLPAAAYLVLTGRWVEALVLVGWGVASWFVVDYVIYVRIAGDRMRLHQIPALLAFLGGLAVFGVSGMILGPAILAVTVAVLEVWNRPATGAEAFPARAEPGGPARP